MAGRTNKASLDYFELDCHMDDKVRLIQAEFGLKGFAVFVKLLQEIYGGYGYYCEWTQDRGLLFTSENGLDGGSLQFIKEIVSACIRRNIFSERLYKEYGILTSSGVQKQYLKATVRREVVELKKEYLLITIPKNNKNVVINSIYDNIDSISSGRNEHSKEEKSREDNNTLSNDNVRQTDVRRVIDKWNSLKQFGITPVIKITTSSKRYTWLKGRLSEYGIDDVLVAIDKIKDSDFLLGKSKSGWMITFDWFVRPTNFPKVLEGNYDNGKSLAVTDDCSQAELNEWGEVLQ